MASPTPTYQDWQKTINMKKAVDEMDKPREDGQDWIDYPEGECSARIVGTKPVTSSSGTHGLELTFAIPVQATNVNGSQRVAVKTLRQHFWLTPNAVWFGIVPLCKATHYLPDEGEFDHMQLVGRSLQLFLVKKASNNGKMYSNIDNDKDSQWGSEKGMRPITPEKLDWLNNMLAIGGLKQAGTEAF